MPQKISRFQVPDLGIGVGYRVPHYREVVEAHPSMDWFEILSENFMVSGGSPLYYLERLADQYPIIPHGVSFSLGGEEDPEHVHKLSQLVKKLRPPWFSDHLCWTGSRHHRLHDLVPVPYHPGLLPRLVDRIRRMMDQTETLFAIENVSAYMLYDARHSPWREWEFLAELAEKADCGLLLDVNNIYVSSKNLGFDPQEYLRNIPHDRVVQIHLAGHSDRGHYCIDTHDHPVPDPVWVLYHDAIARIGSVSTLIEWDGNIPAFSRLQEEAQTAREVRERALSARQDPRPHRDHPQVIDAAFSWEDLQNQISIGIGQQLPLPLPLAPAPMLMPAEQLGIYQEQYRLRMWDALVEEAPGLTHLLGARAQAVLGQYLKDFPPQSWTLNRIAYALPGWLDSQLGEERAMVEMAALEVSISKSFEARNPVAILPDSLAVLPRLVLAPTVFLHRFTYPVHHVRSALLTDGELPALLPGDYPVVVFRRGLGVRHMDVEPAFFELISRIWAGEETESALLGVVMADPDGLSPRVAGWFQSLAEAMIVEAVKEPPSFGGGISCDLR